MTDLQVTLTVVGECASALRNSQSPDAQRTYNDIQDAMNKVQQSLDQTVDFLQDKLLNEGKGLSRLSLSERKRKKLLELREVVIETHENLRTVLIATNLLVSNSLVT